MTDALLQLGSRRELFLDHDLIERMDHTCLRLHEPAPGGEAIHLDQPWEGPANYGLCVFQHAGRYFLYYRAMTIDAGDDSGVLCVALSTDGQHWEKPPLGLVERAGCRATNISADQGGSPRMLLPWLDTRPGVPEQERIKAIASEPLNGESHTAFADPAGPKRLSFWVSPDGFTFERIDSQPGMVSSLPNCFDGGNTLFWSEAEGQYVLYYRWYDGEWGKGWRSIARATSPDLQHWSESVPMGYSGTPREQFYTNNTTAYFRAPHQYLAFAARFMEGRRVLDDEQVQASGLLMAHGHFYGGDCSDAVLLTSRAGSLEYQRTFMEAYIRPGLGGANWVSRTNYPLSGLLPLGQDQLMLFVNRHYMQSSWHIQRLLLRVDGFASLNAPWAGGEMLSKPFTFSGSQLELNYRTSAAGSLRVEIQAGDGSPLAGFGLADCDEIIGDEVRRVVRWRGSPNLGGLQARPVRLRLALRDADLFSFQFGF